MDAMSAFDLFLILFCPALIAVCAYAAISNYRRVRDVKRDLRTARAVSERLTTEMRELAASGHPCQTERDILVNAAKLAAGADLMLDMVEEHCHGFAAPTAGLRWVLDMALLDFAKASTSLEIIRSNLQPLIGRVREASADAMWTVSCGLLAAMEKPADQREPDIVHLLAAAERAAHLAPTAPVRALRQFRDQARRHLGVDEEATASEPAAPSPTGESRTLPANDGSGTPPPADGGKTTQ